MHQYVLTLPCGYLTTRGLSKLENLQFRTRHPELDATSICKRY